MKWRTICVSISAATTATIQTLVYPFLQVIYQIISQVVVQIFFNIGFRTSIRFQEDYKYCVRLTVYAYERCEMPIWDIEI